MQVTNVIACITQKGLSNQAQPFQNGYQSQLRLVRSQVALVLHFV
jgi:hypothetical protein